MSRSGRGRQGTETGEDLSATAAMTPATTPDLEMHVLGFKRHLWSGRGRLAAVATLALALVLLAARKHAPILVFNASASAPIGYYYLRTSALISRHDVVLVRTPESVRALAAERGYIPRSVPLVKRAAALPGDTVCVFGPIVTIDGRWVADRLSADRAGRPLPAWTGCRKLAPGELFLLMEEVPDSFDSRYFGPVSETAVIGRLYPLWLR